MISDILKSLAQFCANIPAGLLMGEPIYAA